MTSQFDIYDDLYRYTGNRSKLSLLRYIIFTPSFKYIYFFRKCQNANNKATRIFWKVLLRHTMVKTGIQIPPETKIDKGFRIVHFGNIVINPITVIGKNFNIANGATIGNSSGKNAGTPTIGDNVCIQANAVVVGNITIGNDAFIAPNAFVNFDVPDGCIAIGNPARIIEKEKASAKYIVYKI